MSEISRTALFGKLAPVAYKAIESATLFCKMRGNPYVELSHWIHQLLQHSDTDLQRIIKHFGLDPAPLARDLTAALDRLPRGASSVSDLAVQVEESVERGWVYGSLLYNEAKVRSGHLVIGWVKTPSLRNYLGAISPQFARIKADDLTDNFSKITDGSPEALEAQALASAAAATSADGSPAPAALGRDGPDRGA